MSSQEPNKPEAEHVAPEPRTQVQAEEAVAASVELSIPDHVHRHAKAPEAAGYVLTEPLGEGAYGQVWRAWQIRTRKEVAVKVFMQRSGLDWIFLQREVERLARLDRHPHIVTLLDMALDEEPPFYVMDVIEGGALQAFVSPETRADPERATTWMAQICDALSYIHAKGLIHCDLKPANILVDGRDQVRVVDFGQSRIFTESSASIGTLFYMAPQQARLAEPGTPVQPDVRWDIYALGASIYAILIGRPPHADGTNAQLLEQAPNLAERLERYREMVEDGPELSWNGQAGGGVDPELIAVASKCMAINPDDRYSSVTEVAQDLKAMRERRPVSPLAASVGYRSKKFLQRNPFKVLLTLVVIALGVALVSGSLRQARLDRAEAAQLMARVVHDPADAVLQFSQVSNRTHRHLLDLTEQFVASAAFTERVMGARAGLWLDPHSFWNSVDGGALWENGEWLELASAFGAEYFAAPHSERMVGFLSALEGALHGSTARRQYVALCILGELRQPREDAAQTAADLVRTSTEPGPVMAAAWAARRLGREVSVSTKERVFVDDLTGTVFSLIPGASAFRRGSDSSDPDRFPDEVLSDEGVAVGPFYMASTELTLAAFAGFLDDSPGGLEMTPEERRVVRGQFEAVTPEEIGVVAVGGLSLQTARRYCEWLSKLGAAAEPRRSYRLPSEDEWEYAARAGNSGRFCFGDDAGYARYFAHCDGSSAPWHVVGQRMPNFFGLFDMHGGLWEHTDSKYPAEHTPPELANTELFVRRGGAWYSPAVRCRSAQRNYHTANAVDVYTGVRLIMELRP
ncbi:MAG: protein kinase [Planctomycetes bacterium]|nr:protein kinase [Planctomycetota bacterium]